MPAYGIPEAIKEICEEDSSITPKRLRAKLISRKKKNDSKPANEREDKYNFNTSLIPTLEQVSNLLMIY